VTIAFQALIILIFRCSGTHVQQVHAARGCANSRADLRLARQNGIQASEVYEVDASRQSKRVSANVSGIMARADHAERQPAQPLLAAGIMSTMGTRWGITS